MHFYFVTINIFVVAMHYALRGLFSLWMVTLVQLLWAELVELDRGVIIAVAVASSVGFVTLSYLELAGYDPYFATDYITREDYAAEELHGPMVYFVFETLCTNLFCGCMIGAELHAYKRRVQALQLDRERRIAAAARLDDVGGGAAMASAALAALLLLAGAATRTHRGGSSSASPRAPPAPAARPHAAA